MTGVLKVSLVGRLPNGEVWSVNPVWDLPTGDFPLTYDEMNAIATAINAIAAPTAVRVLWSSQTQLTGVRLEHRAKTGELLMQFEQQRATPQNGSSATGLPLQISIVSSLRTTGSGAHARGRLYWPGTGATLDTSSLRFTAALVPAFAGGVKTMLSDITTAINATSASPILSVWSRSLSSTLPVNRILAGDVPDVQRRRRDAAIETYSAVVFP